MARSPRPLALAFAALLLAAAVGGLHGRAAEPGGVPELRAGGEHGGDARPDLLLGAPGRGARRGGLPLPGVPGRPEPRHPAQHDQGPAAARRLQGQDAARQQVPRFCSWCAQRVSSSCSICRGPVLQSVTVVASSFGIASRDRDRLQHSSSLPGAFSRGQPLGSISTELFHGSSCCRYSARVPYLVSPAHQLCSSVQSVPSSYQYQRIAPIPSCIL